MSQTNSRNYFPKYQQQTQRPNNSVQKPNNRIHYHIASKTQKIYSPFQQKYYIPPHLNSSGFSKPVNYGECKKWNNKDTFNKENYQNQYDFYERKIQYLPRKFYDVDSRIGYLVNDDRPIPGQQRSEHSLKIETVFQKRTRPVSPQQQMQSISYLNN